MLNMKKGLAIVLAAATALTFAPVSTLGLTGVVQAQAAALSGTSATLTALTVAKSLADTNYDTWDSSADANATGTATLGSGNEYFGVKITAGTEKTKYTIKTTGSSVSRFGDTETADVKGKTSFELAGSTSNSVVFKAAAKGKTTVTIVAHDTTTADATGDKTLTLNFVVHGPVSSAKFEDSAINVLGAASATQDAVIDFTGALTNDTYYLVSGNSAIFTVADKADGDTSTAAAAKGKLSADAKDTVTLTSVAPGDTYLYVYADQTSADADTDHTKALAKVPVHVAGYSLKATASGFTTVDKLGTLDITTVNPTDSVTLKFLNGNTDVTDQFKLYKDTNGLAASNPVTAASNKATVYVKAPAAGTYTVEATVGAKTVKTTFTVGGSVSTKPTTPTAKADSAVFGGVTTHLYATDNTTYNLVNSDAEFELNNRKYTANQLKWYLTKSPNETPANMGLTQGSGSIGASTNGRLIVNVANATQFANDVNPSPATAPKAYIVGIYTSGADNTIVYQGALSVTPAAAGVVTKTYAAPSISTSQAQIAAATDGVISKDFLGSVRFIGVNNRYLTRKNAKIISVENGGVGTHFNATIPTNQDASGDNLAKDSKLTATSPILRDGAYYEKYYVEYQDTTSATPVTFIAEISVTVSVSAGPTVEVKEGNFTYSLTAAQKDDQSLRDEKVIDLDLTTNKTFDIAAHTISNKDNTSYAYIPDTQNVTVDAKGVVTAAKVGTAVVEVVPTAAGVTGEHVFVFFRVNQNANDKITVTGKDGDKATVLTTRQYNGNTSRLATEAGLASAQVGYVQVEVTGDETADVKENLTVKGNGTLSFSLPNEKDKDIASVDAKTGQITISHDYLNKHYKENGQPYAFPVKVVSTETASSALTTSYFYVVVDYADASITGLEDSYEVGTSLTETKSPSWLNLGLTEDEGVKHVSSNARPQDYNVHELTKDDDLDDSKLYDADDSSVFNRYHNSITCAIAAGKTEHVLVSASNVSQKIGHTYRVVTIKSVAGQTNYVTKIENVETGKTIYQQGAGVNSGASITISKPTKVKVTVAHTPDTSLVAKDDPAFTIGFGSDEFNNNMQNIFVAATENPTTYEVTLIPSIEGTQIIDLLPTQGRLSKTDYSLVGTEDLKVAVKYSTADSKTPAQVKGVKLGNKKGAKVVVKFTKDTTDKNIKYYVQKKVGKKTSGKSVGSNRTILSVKKGATVKVRVKAYYYDANGTKHVGKYSKWVTKKTDKK